jgi:hypothetical protein
MMYRQCGKCGHVWWQPERCPECEVAKLQAALRRALDCDLLPAHVRLDLRNALGTVELASEGLSP